MSCNINPAKLFFENGGLLTNLSVSKLYIDFGLERASDPSLTRWGTQHLQRARRGHVGNSKLDSLRTFQLFYNVRTMALIAQPYSQDACGIGSGAFSALGWAESRFGIVFFVVIFSIVVISIIVISIICAAYFPLFASLHLPPAAMMTTTLSL